MSTSRDPSPPLGGNCGWGEDTDPIHHKLFKERIATEVNCDDGVYTPTRELVLAKGEETPMEKLVRAAMPYDDGWDLDYVDRLLYGGPAYVDQDGVGSCVGAGGVSAVASKAATEIMLEGDPENPFGMIVQQYQTERMSAVPNVDFSYGCGKMKQYYRDGKFTTERRLGDGSYCAAQIWAFSTCGILPCSEVLDDGVFPQTKRIQSNAGNQNQFLNRHLSIGQKYLMENTVRVTSADDLKEVITVLKQPCMICSGWAFTPRQEKPGLGWVYKKQGSWSHNMTLVACVLFKGNWYVKVRNQWGANAHKDGWHFWIPLELFAQWVRSAECQSIGELKLIPANSIPNFPF